MQVFVAGNVHVEPTPPRAARRWGERSTDRVVVRRPEASGGSLGAPVSGATRYEVAEPSSLSRVTSMVCVLLPPRNTVRGRCHRGGNRGWSPPGTPNP